MRIPAERRRAAEQRSRLVFAIPDVADAVTAVENSGMHGVLHLERRHDRAGREHIELQASAGHGVRAGVDQVHGPALARTVVDRHFAGR